MADEKKVEIAKFAGSALDFIKRAITNLRKEYMVKKGPNAGETRTSDGIHSVYSGFNEAYRVQAEVNKWELDPIKFTTDLAAKGLIDSRPARGGAMLYHAGQAPTGRAVSDTLGKIFG